MRQRVLRPAALVRVIAMTAAVALVTLLAACGNVIQTVPPTGSSAAPTPGSTSGGTAGPGSPAPPSLVRAYFGLGSTAGNPVIAPVERPSNAQAVLDRARVAMDALVAGPSDTELSGTPAMFTAIPASTQVAALQIDAAGVATVDLSEAFEETEELPALRTALAQVVFTLTQFPEVSGVNVTIAGAVLNQTDADGRDLPGPATRADYEDQMGPLFVDSPAWGASLRSPMHLAGLADVFEAQFRFRLLDADGRSLADHQLIASCGTGCLGTFSAEVPFNVSASTAGRLQVFDQSEADGSIADVVDYPVTLLP